MPRGVPGPVKKTSSKARGEYFVKGGKPGPGRPKGVPNKFTGDVKEAILAGLNGGEGGLAAFVAQLREENPASAAALLGRFIPIATSQEIDLKHEVKVTFG